MLLHHQVDLELREHVVKMLRLQKTKNLPSEHPVYIRKKIDALDFLLDEQEPGLVLMTEHGLKEDQTGHLQLSNYTLHTSYCRTNIKGGGSANYSAIPKVKPLDYYSFCFQKVFELCCVQVEREQKYRAGRGNH